MIDAAGSDQTDCRLADPFPEHHILVHGAGLELLLLLQVEDLQGAGLGLESNYLTGPVHDGTISLDGPPRNVVAILQLDDDDLGLCGFALLFSDAHVGVGL